MKTVFLTFFMLVFVPVVQAQTRCECEYDDWVDDCDAEFERKGDWILFKSDTEQCSRIDWHTDSQPRLTIVEDGKETVNLMGIPQNAEISIASCKVCKDSKFKTSKPSAGGASGGNPVIRNAYDTLSRCGFMESNPMTFEQFTRGFEETPGANGTAADLAVLFSEDIERQNDLKAVAEFSSIVAQHQSKLDSGTLSPEEVRDLQSIIVYHQRRVDYYRGKVRVRDCIISGFGG